MWVTFPTWPLLGTFSKVNELATLTLLLFTVVCYLITTILLKIDQSKRVYRSFVRLHDNVRVLNRVERVGTIK